MSDSIKIHPAGECPGGCEEVKAVEKRFSDGATRMTSIESSLSALSVKFAEHIKVSSDTNGLVTEVLSILQAGKGFFRVMGYIATGVKWTAALLAPVIALVYTIKGGGGPNGG